MKVRWESSKHYLLGFAIGGAFMLMWIVIMHDNTMNAAQNTTACNSYYQRAAAAADGSQAQANLAAMASACYLKASR